MKKTLTLLTLLLISVGAMAQDALQEALEKVNGYWKVDGDKVVVSATIKASTETIAESMSMTYPSSSIETTDTAVYVKRMQFTTTSADEFMDYNARKYKANYEISIKLDTLLYVSVIIDRLDSKTDADDCMMADLYPINTERRIVDGYETSLRNDERIKINEGIIFSKIIDKAISEINGIGSFIGGEVLFDIAAENNESVAVVTSETHAITLHLDKFRKTALIGEGLMIGGSALAFSSIFFDNPKGAKAALIGGGIIGIAGYITHLSAYSHLKPNKVSFSANGVVYSF